MVNEIWLKFDENVRNGALHYWLILVGSREKAEASQSTARQSNCSSQIIFHRRFRHSFENDSVLLLKDLFNANACWLVLIYDTLIITYVAKRISKICVIYFIILFLLFFFSMLRNAHKKASTTKILSVTSSVNHCLITNAIDNRYWIYFAWWLFGVGSDGDLSSPPPPPPPFGTPLINYLKPFVSRALTTVAFILLESGTFIRALCIASIST